MAAVTSVRAGRVGATKHEIGERFRGRLFRVYIPVALFTFITLFPFYWMAITSIKSNSELLDHTKNPLFVLEPNLQNYHDLFFKTNFIRWMVNSGVVAVASTTISLISSILAGYSLARLRYRGASAIGWGVFVTYLVPPTLLFLPMAYVIAHLHLFNSYWSLILTYPTFLIPFSTWLLMGYFRGIPRELEEAALVDGATRIQAMVRVVVPLALPGILSAGMFAFTLSWGEFLYALVFMSDTALKTVPVGVVNELIKGDEFFWGELMAAALLGAVPVA